VRDVISALGPQLAGALATTAVAFGLRVALPTGIPAIERMAILAVFYAALYLALVVGLFRVTLPVQVLLAFVGGGLPRPLHALTGTLMTRLAARESGRTAASRTAR
jgi:hypothetical protein